MGASRSTLVLPSGKLSQVFLALNYLFKARLRLKVEVKSVSLEAGPFPLGTAGCGGEVRTRAGRAAAGWTAAVGEPDSCGAEPCTAVWGVEAHGAGRRSAEQAGRAHRA